MEKRRHYVRLLQIQTGSKTALGGEHSEAAEKHIIRKNLEDSGNKHTNPFSILQYIEEESISTTIENCGFELGVDDIEKRRNIDVLKARLSSGFFELSHK